VEQGDEAGEAGLDGKLDDGVGRLDAGLGPGRLGVVDLDGKDPAVEQQRLGWEPVDR
jgi:hypothetical protein